VCRSPRAFVKQALDRRLQRYLFAFGLTGMNHDPADRTARDGGLATATV
jgi:hypothetical protein